MKSFLVYCLCTVAVILYLAYIITPDPLKKFRYCNFTSCCRGATPLCIITSNLEQGNIYKFNIEYIITLQY